MNKLIEDFKENIIFHYLSGDTWDLNVNPNYFYEGRRKYSPEEELVLTMYVQEEMQHLELYEKDGETKFRKIGEIPVKDQLFYYKTNYTHLRDHYYEFANKLQKLMDMY